MPSSEQFYKNGVKHTENAMIPQNTIVLFYLYVIV